MRKTLILGLVILVGVCFGLCGGAGAVSNPLKSEELKTMDAGAPEKLVDPVLADDAVKGTDDSLSDYYWGTFYHTTDGELLTWESESHRIAIHARDCPVLGNGWYISDVHKGSSGGWSGPIYFVSAETGIIQTVGVYSNTPDTIETILISPEDSRYGDCLEKIIDIITDAYNLETSPSKKAQIGTVRKDFNSIREKQRIDDMTLAEVKAGPGYRLNNNPFAVKSWIEMLKENTKLKWIDFEDNFIGGDDAKLVAEMLKVNTGLMWINLRHNFVGDDGTIELAGAMKVNKVVKWLGLGDNFIGDDGAAALAGVIEVNTNLKELDLSDNVISNDGAIAIAGVLEDTNLEKLDLSGNFINDEGVIEIALSLYETNLKEIDLRDNWFDEEGKAALREVQKHTECNILF